MSERKQPKKFDRKEIRGRYERRVSKIEEGLTGNFTDSKG